MNHWMHALAEHFETCRKKYPNENLLLLFDIDGTILDMRHLMLYLFQRYDQEKGARLFAELKLDDIDIHENQLPEFFARHALSETDKNDFLAWYEENRWVPSAVIQSHRPYQGVLEVIRWFQIQSNTMVGLNTGRPEFLREDTLRSLNTLGREFRVHFQSRLLYMNPNDWDHDVTRSKRAGIEHFRRQGYRIVAFIDNEPANLMAVAEADPEKEILLLHADTLFESPLQQRPNRSVIGKDYDLTALIQERHLPAHVHMVWNGIEEVANFRQFLGSNINWGELEWPVEQSGLGSTVHAAKRFDKSLKIRFSEGGEKFEQAIDYIDEWRLPAERLWFHAPMEIVGEEGIRALVAAFPRAILETSIDFMVPMLQTDPAQAKRVLDRLSGWGIRRFALTWASGNLAQVVEQLQSWNLEIHFQGVSDLESFLQAILLLPTSITADFNFPQWRYFGVGKSHSQNATKPIVLQS